MTDLGTLGGENSVSKAINHFGEVTGMSERFPVSPGDNRVFHAFLWSGGEMIDLSVIGGFSSSDAYGINDAGQVIVGGRPTDGRGGAYLYDPAKGMRRLDTLLSPGRHWHAVAPRAINDAGQMVGSGEFYGLTRAFLMTPLDADFDDDGDTDLIDFDAFRACMTGPGAPVDIECKEYDIDRNGRIDMVDLRAFQWVFGTP